MKGGIRASMSIHDNLIKNIIATLGTMVTHISFNIIHLQIDIVMNKLLKIHGSKFQYQIGISYKYYSIGQPDLNIIVVQDRYTSMARFCERCKEPKNTTP